MNSNSCMLRTSYKKHQVHHVHILSVILGSIWFSCKGQKCSHIKELNCYAAPLMESITSKRDYANLKLLDLPAGVDPNDLYIYIYNMGIT